MMPLIGGPWDGPWLLAISVLAPLVVLAFLPLIGRRTGLVAMAAGAAPALLAASTLSPGVSLDLPWLLLGARLTLDPVGAVFLLFTSLLWLIASFYAAGSLWDDPAARRFAACFLLAMAGNVSVVLAADIASFYTAFALMSFASFGLVVHRGDDDARQAGQIYLVLVVVGEVALFVGMTISAGMAGSMALPGSNGVDPGWLVTTLLVIGFGLKAGMVPLHVWLPLAHPAAPIAASAVLSGAMIKAGLLGLMRFLPIDTLALPVLGDILMLAGLVAAFFGVLIGLTQINPKTVLAYSSISQMGLMLMALGVVAAAPDAMPGALLALALIAFHHGLAKGALFFACGFKAVPYGRTGRFVLGLGMLLPALALAGAPFTSGSLAKTALDQLSSSAPEPMLAWLPVLLPASATGTALLMARFLVLTWPRYDGAAAVSSLALTAFVASVSASVGLIWWLPGAAAYLPISTDAEKLAGGLTPLAIAAAVTMLVLGWRVRLAAGVPAGDFLTLLAAPVRRLSTYGKRAVDQLIAASNALFGMSSRSLAMGRRLGQGVDSLELQFRAFSVAGACLILLILASFAVGVERDDHEDGHAVPIEKLSKAPQG